MDKIGKLSTLIVIAIFLLPIIGLLIMDYQLKKANDITGAYLAEDSEAYAFENMLASIVVGAMVVVTLLALVVVRVRHSRMISTTPLAKINREIDSIDDQLKRKLR